MIGNVESYSHKFGIDDLLRDEALTEAVCYNIDADRSLSELSGCDLSGSRFVFFFLEHELLTRLFFLRPQHNDALSPTMNCVKSGVIELIGERYSMCFMRRPEGLPILINIPDTDSRPNSEIYSEIISLINKLLQRVSQELDIELKADVSSVCSGDGAAHKAFTCSRSLMRYREIMSLDSPVLLYDDYYLSPYYETNNARTFEMRLFPSVRVCDFQETRKLLNQMANELFYNSRPSLLTVEHRLAHMKSQVLNLIGEMSVIVSREMFEDIRAAERILEARSVKKLMSEVEYVFDRVEEFCRTTLVEMPPIWLRDVCKFIDDNYTDSSLNISTIADHFGLNSDYLSRSFKRLRGLSILDYIHMLRITDARRYIMSGLPAAVVAQKVGYGHERTMTRAFKKYDGITPGMLVRSPHDRSAVQSEAPVSEDE